MTEKPIHLDVNCRHDFVLFFDVVDGNPNGDPDAGNLPRVDPETMQGLVSDVSIKRRVRDWVDVLKGDEAPYKIYVQSRGIALNDLHERAYKAEEMKSTGTKQKREDVDKARAWMCQNFFDIRTFGAVMTTGVNCGQVRGPIQLTFARSTDPVVPLDISITRVAVTRPEDAQIVQSSDDSEAKGGKTTEMGRKAIIPYGLYRAHGFFMPHLAARTGFDAEDLSIVWQALEDMWDLDRSSSRGLMSCRGLYIFSHDKPLGNAPAYKLFERIQAAMKDGVEAPRRFLDYHVSVDRNCLPEGVTFKALCEG